MEIPVSLLAEEPSWSEGGLSNVRMVIGRGSSFFILLPQTLSVPQEKSQLPEGRL